MKLPVIIFVFICATVLIAFEDLGPLKKAQKKYPDIFKTGSINLITINNTPCYVFSGNSEQAFTGEFAEKDSELYEEATLSAKSNFYESLSKKNKNATITMSNCKVLYQYNNNKLYTVVLFVPKNNVTIKSKQTSTKIIATVAPSVATTTNKVAPAKQLSNEPATTVSAPTKIQASIGKAQSQKISSIERRIQKYQKRIKKNSNDIVSLISLANLYKKSNSLKESAKFYRLAISKIEQDKYFDQNEKINIIYTVASIFEQLEKNNLALKYYYYLLRHKCSIDMRKKSIAAISKIRLKMID